MASVIDSVGGNDNDGVNDGATIGVSGKILTAYDFSSNNHVDISGASSTLNNSFPGAYTMSAWVYLDEHTGSYKNVFFQDATNGDRGWWIDNNGKIFAQVAPQTGSTVNYSTGVSFASGAWIHIGMTAVANGTTFFYVNGSAVYNSSSPATLRDTYTISGISHIGAQPWNGKIDEVGIWSRVLSGDEMLSLTNAGAGLPFSSMSGAMLTNIEAYYKLDEVAAVPTNLKLNIADAWKEVSAAKINIGDSWKEIAGAKINIGDSWKTIF